MGAGSSRSGATDTLATLHEAEQRRPQVGPEHVLEPADWTGCWGRRLTSHLGTSLPVIAYRQPVRSPVYQPYGVPPLALPRCLAVVHLYRRR